VPIFVYYPSAHRIIGDQTKMYSNIYTQGCQIKIYNHIQDPVTELFKRSKNILACYLYSTKKSGGGLFLSRLASLAMA
jgi:hypothetical protein